MYLSFLSSPQATEAFLAGRVLRAQTAARLSYLAIDGLARAGTAAFDVVARALAGLARARRRRAAIDELSGLDSRTLKDIGLSRGDIPSVVSELLDSAPRTRVRTVARKPAAVRAQAAPTPPARNENHPARAA
jgi:uncharacterized protein YjiS (DUF1127 family)